MSQDICHSCGDSYSRLGSHWTGDCSPPELTDKQLDIVRGLLMGDGWLTRRGNSDVRVKMTNREYLESLDDEFGILGTGVAVSEEFDNPDWNTTYQWSTRAHTELNQFDSWYSSGDKVWPADIELTPIVLKHWYAGDGHLEERCGNHRIKLSMSNEAGNEEKIAEMFKRVGLEYNSWIEYETDDGRKTVNLQFTNRQSEQMLDYMGEPLPGFNYKWATSGD